jgi:hypothetical protein
MQKMQLNNKDEEMKDETISKEDELRFNEFRNYHYLSKCF